VDAVIWFTWALPLVLAGLACGLTRMAQYCLRSGPPWPERLAVSRGWNTACCQCPNHESAWRAHLPAYWLDSLHGCRHCQQHYGWWHRSQQLALVTTNLFVFWTLGWQPASLAYGVYLSFCFLLCTIDWQQHWLPDGLTLPLAGLGLLAAITHTTPVAWQDALIGCVAAFLSLELIAAGYRLWRNREGLGGGDSKLLAAFGAWFGWTPLPSIVAIAAGIGIIVALWRAQQYRVNTQAHIAFGPCLCVASWWALYGQIQHYCI
jgi:prepilin signal peptidase PulO-like enzyme (type II secretory pathway)